MSKKLTKHGNSLALVIDKPLLRLLSITEKTDLEISIENGALIIRPAEMQATRSKHEIKKIAQEIMEEYGDVFKKLAE
jgi:antitoxin MazE